MNNLDHVFVHLMEISQLIEIVHLIESSIFYHLILFYKKGFMGYIILDHIMI